MWCLTLATNAVVTWTTEYNGLAVTALRRAGRDIDDAVLAHIWPTHHENIHFYGTTPSTSTGSSPSSAPMGTGRCVPPRRTPSPGTRKWQRRHESPNSGFRRQATASSRSKVMAAGVLVLRLRSSAGKPEEMRILRLR
jgi:hypothetical protein